MTACNLQQRDDGLWHCPECDPGQQRLLPVPARRKCDTGLPAVTTQASPAEQLLAAAMAGWRDLGRVFVDETELQRRVNVCAACDQFDAGEGICRRRNQIPGSPCYARSRLVEALLLKRCEEW